jgi:hypothetical protein
VIKIPIYKLTGRAHLKDIGRFFRTAGTNIFRFLPGELQEMSNELLESVKQYVPVRTGTLQSSLIAQAEYNAIQVVARTAIMEDSAYRKDYAEFVEAGVFGKDKSRVIPTPDFGGPALVKSPKAFEGDIIEQLTSAAIGEAAHEVEHGYAQFMRAGIYDVWPKLLSMFSRIIDPRWKALGRKLGAK